MSRYRVGSIEGYMLQMAWADKEVRNPIKPNPLEKKVKDASVEKSQIYTSSKDTYQR